MTEPPKFLVRMTGYFGTFEAIVNFGKEVDTMYSFNSVSPIYLPSRSIIGSRHVNVYWHDTGDDRGIEMKLEYPISSILQLIRNIDLPPCIWDWVISCKVVEEL